MRRRSRIGVTVYAGQVVSNAAGLRTSDEKPQGKRHAYKYGNKKAKLVSYYESIIYDFHRRSKAGILLKTKGGHFCQAKPASADRSITCKGEKKAKQNWPWRLKIGDRRLGVQTESWLRSAAWESRLPATERLACQVRPRGMRIARAVPTITRPESKIQNRQWPQRNLTARNAWFRLTLRLLRGDACSTWVLSATTWNW